MKFDTKMAFPDPGNDKWWYTIGIQATSFNRITKFYIVVKFPDIIGLLQLTLVRANLTTVTFIDKLTYLSMGHLTSKFNFKTVPVLHSLDPSLISPFYILLSPVHPTRISFCLITDFLAFFYLAVIKEQRLLQTPFYC